MLAYKEIIKDDIDLEKVINILQSLQKQHKLSEVIILPIEDNSEMIQAQSKSLSNVWDNDSDEEWNNV